MRVIPKAVTSDYFYILLSPRFVARAIIVTDGSDMILTFSAISTLILLIVRALRLTLAIQRSNFTTGRSD